MLSCSTWISGPTLSSHRHRLPSEASVRDSEFRQKRLGRSLEWSKLTRHASEVDLSQPSYSTYALLPLLHARLLKNCRDQDTGSHLQEVGAEFGTTTGRRRRCGWLDLVVLRHSALINGYDAFNLTKLDVLDALPEIKVGIGYEVDGVELEGFPGTVVLGCPMKAQANE